MNIAFILFPHQLFENTHAIPLDATVFLVEEYLFFSQYAFHKQKIVFHRASMQNYQNHVSKTFNTTYINAQTPLHDCRNLIENLSHVGFQRIMVYDPVDDWLLSRVQKSCLKFSLKLTVLESPCFINTMEELNKYTQGKNRFFQTHFYIEQRKIRNILVNDSGEPAGGKWSFDPDNRKKYPPSKVPPPVSFPELKPIYRNAIDYVETHFKTNPGHIHMDFIYPVTHNEAKIWLNDFIAHRLYGFGTYEDAILQEHRILHHSLLSPLINTGLLLAEDVSTTVIQKGVSLQIEMNNIEGFVRQVLGWREFIRMVYIEKGRIQRTTNYWHFTRKIPPSFYTGETGIFPIDHTIKQVLKTGYCHHIERLMILGNFMLLCEFDPNEVYQWFMEMFIDAYDWVMVPNVYGMSQFADGGLMATKPYISSSHYILKMSDYPKGDWCIIWDALFWHFLHKHRHFFTRNPRMSMLIKQYDKRPESDRIFLLEEAKKYLSSLDESFISLPSKEEL